MSHVVTTFIPPADMGPSLALKVILMDTRPLHAKKLCDTFPGKKCIQYRIFILFIPVGVSYQLLITWLVLSYKT
jgi:hypothetical protein